MERPSRLPLALGVLLLVCGWAVIFLAWYQAGRQELETGQLPYVISGGFGGFGLILMGVIAILVDVVRQAESKLRRSAEDLHERMQVLAETFVAEQSLPEAGSSMSSTRGARPRTRRRAQQRRTDSSATEPE